MGESLTTETQLQGVYQRKVEGERRAGEIVDPNGGGGSEVLKGAEGQLEEDGLVEDECKKLLEKFSSSSSDFIRCATHNAKPILMCRNCEKDFLAVRTNYLALEHSESQGINCKALFTSRDKVEIIKATYSYIGGPGGLWFKGHCDSCYTRPLSSNSTLTPITTRFFALARTVKDCFAAHPNSSLDTNRRSEACTQCRVDYLALNSFYREQVFSSFPFLSGICFDIIDTMNMTQRQWGSDHYQCGRKLKGSFPLLIAVACVLITPGLFYFTSRYFNEPRWERTMVRGHITDRLAQAQREHENSREPENQVTDRASTSSSADLQQPLHL